MAYDYKLPSLGDGVTGKVLEILVKPGDKVEKEQIVLIVGTDKVDAEMPVDAAGTVSEILVTQGDDVTEGTVILRLATTGTSAESPKVEPVLVDKTPTAPATPTPEATTAHTSSASGVTSYEFKLPSLGEGVTGKVVDILVNPGDKVSKDQIVAVIGTDKVDAEMPVDAAGEIEEVLIKKGDDVTEGMPILRMKAEGLVAAPTPAAAAPTPATPPAAPAPTAVPAASVPPSTGKVANLRISPLARKRAKEFGVDLAQVKPVEGGSRISYKDVIDYAKKQLSQSGGSAQAGGHQGLQHKKLPNFERFGAIERKPLTRIGQITADNMVYAFSAIPHAWISEKADITKLEALRQQYKDQVKAKGGALTTTAILTKAVAAVLHKMPQFNASFDPETNEVIYKKFINIGIAVDTPRGLLVPVIRNAGQKGLVDISVELAELSTRTRDGKNKPDDLDGGTFSISNIGGIGGTNMISIVNWPQVAILSITAAQMEAVWNGQAFEPRLMMPMTIGWDHRVINGADAARFLVELKQILEEPFLGWF